MNLNTKNTYLLTNAWNIKTLRLIRQCFVFVLVLDQCLESALCLSWSKDKYSKIYRFDRGEPCAKNIVLSLILLSPFKR